MSISIRPDCCIGCGKCARVCPGNLIKIYNKKAFIKRERDCWGCTSCLKECNQGAIDFFLGADLGGRGSILSVSQDKINKDVRLWTVTDPRGNKKVIEINTKESNKY